jgi:hypothetical protein
MRDRDDRDEYGEPRERRGGNNAIVIGLSVAVLLGLVGVAVWYFTSARGETAGAVIAQYRPKFADVRAKLKRIAGKLPPGGSVGADTLPANLNPKPVYDVPRKEFNTAIVMAEQCDVPDRDPKSPFEFNLRFHEDEFLTHLVWTGDHSPMVESARKSSAGDLAQRFERSLGLSYLVVARPVMFHPPRAVDDKTFTGCDVDLEVFLVDLPGEKVLGGFRRQFRPDANVMVTFRKDRRESESVEAFVYSNMWSKARTEVAATLARATGGTFVIDR